MSLKNIPIYVIETTKYFLTVISPSKVKEQINYWRPNKQSVWRLGIHCICPRYGKGLNVMGIQRVNKNTTIYFERCNINNSKPPYWRRVSIGRAKELQKQAREEALILQLAKVK